LRLPRSLVDHISHQMVRALAREGAIDVQDKAAAAAALAEAFTDDLLVEDRLNEEVREIMNSYADEMTRQGVNYHEMFKKIKQELVRKRKLIL
jgi:hypothetical protein